MRQDEVGDRGGILAGEPSFADALRVLCLQAAGDGRGAAFFGGGAARACEIVAPFLVGELFPEIYLEFPLAGEPFLDVTVLYGDLALGTRIDSPLAAGTDAALDLYARERGADKGLAMGFELDCGEDDAHAATVHFQPRGRRDLVRPFCEAAGDPGAADLYLSQAARMPEGWPLSFLGMFRGRLGSPLRVCGYLEERERTACARDSGRLARALDQAGFVAYDQAMLAQAARVLALAPADADFQLDVLPDGSLGETFALDVRFGGMSEREVRDSFACGEAALVVAQLGEWGVADGRAALVAGMTLTRGVPVVRPDGSAGRYGFSLVPGWLKVRWRDGVLQPAKMYLRAGAGPVRKGGSSTGRGGR